MLPQLFNSLKRERGAKRRNLCSSNILAREINVRSAVILLNPVKYEFSLPASR